jgi:hypothetical protein
VTERTDRRDPARRARAWRRFADACRDRSPLYARLSLAIAEDLEVDRLLAAAPTTQLGHPTLLFAAVHDLLLAGTDAPDLAAHYPSLGSVAAAPDEDPWPAFRALCMEHRAAIEERIRTRRTQTNEVARSSLVLLGLAAVHAESQRPLAWLDVGTSAGLALRLDRYHHDLGSAGTAGPITTPVSLSCEVDGAAPVDGIPPLAWRGGLDAAPVDVTDPAERRWLEACVWPEQTDRLARLRAALEVAAGTPVPLLRGDAVGDLPAAVAEVPADTHLVISHTWVLAYLSPEGREAFEAALDEVATHRDLDRIGMEGPGAIPGTERGRPSDPSLLLRSRWRDGTRTDRILAEVDDHGRWARWRDTSP